MSGAFGPAYCIQREDEDLAAMVDHTAAECVFGPANGGLFALHGTIGFRGGVGDLVAGLTRGLSS
jgi:hypothetical protein